MNKNPSQAHITITAKVFRARKSKPWYVPQPLWAAALRRQWPGTGRWEEHGVIASTSRHNVDYVPGVAR